MTLALRYRIPKEKIKNAIKFGYRSKNPLFTAFVFENKQKFSRIAVVIPSKAEKSSVARNRTRRQVKEVFRKYEKKFKSPSDIVVIFHLARPLKFQELEKCLRAVFLKLSII